MLPREQRGIENYDVYSRLSIEMNYRGTDDEWHTIEAPHMDLEPTQLAELNESGIFPFIAIVPLLKEGIYLRMHPTWKDKDPETLVGRLVFSPLGTMVIMPASMVYGSGIRTGNGGNPCLKVHYFLVEKSKHLLRETSRFEEMLASQQYSLAAPDGMEKIPQHPSKKLLPGDYTVYFMERDYLVQKSKGKGKSTPTGHRSAGDFYGPKILEDFYELVGL